MKLVVIDDDRLVALSLKTILEADQEVTVAAMGKNGLEAVELYSVHRPDVLLMDIRMDTMTGLEAAKIILRQYPLAKILLLTTFLDDEYIIQALHIGAKGYILKQDFDSILPALKVVFSGQNVFGNEIISKIPALIHTTTPFLYSSCGITEKEEELIKLVASGLSNREISGKMYLSDGTIRNYLSSILEKLSLRDRTQLAIFYYQHK